MLLLAMDTSGAGVTVAVHDGHRVLAEASTDDARRHAELLAPTIEAALREAGAAPTDLTDLAVGVGPGPFTGLRVGLVTARVLGLTLGVAVHGFCSLDALAQAALDADATAVGQRFLVATDARRREVYWAAYEARDGVAVRLEDPSVDAPAAVPREGRVVVGHGVQLYPELLGPVVPQAPEHVRGGALAALAVRRLAAGEGPFPAEPLYLRRPDAVEPGARKRVLAP